MKKGLLSLFSTLVILALFVTPAAARQQDFEALQPGQFVTLEQTIPVNLVFIGYKGIDRGDVLDELPETYDPVVRFPQFYGLDGRNLGLHFDFRYRTINTNSEFEDDFFSYLASAGEPGPLTLFQEEYNNQEKNVLDVTGPVLYIDAPSVEKWLSSKNNQLGIDGAHSYTVYFINWYTRPDFKFHVYTKTDEPDPDTGYNFGELRASRKMIAWGGTSSRSWFYDLSAGPESWSGNYIVDIKDLDENGVEDYRMPPIWEYRRGGYRSLNKLSSDLGLVARFVAINLLFTTSPLYDPLVTAPGVGGSKIVYINLFEDDPDNKGADWIDTNYTRRKLRSFQPYYNWEVHLKDRKIDSATRRAFRIFTGLRQEDSCWNAFGTPFAELFCYFDAKRDKFVPKFDPEDYVGPIYAFNTTDENLGEQFGLLGFADDDWVSGTQTYVFEFLTPTYREFGYGFTTTTIHEFGHHIGLSHPHDGYDSELNLDYGPSDQFFFAWSGDESDTVMSYLGVSNGFGQFDRDNMYRYETAGYLNWSNALLGDILASGKADQVRELLKEADNKAKRALESFEDWDYLDAARQARRAYERILRAAERLGIATPTLDAALQAIPNATAPHEGDPIRFPDN